MVELLVLTLVVALAGYRLARAVSVDDVTLPIRQGLYRWTYERGAPKSYRVFLLDLINCPVCSGWWITIGLGLAASAQLTDAPITQHILLAIAAAGGQCWLTTREAPR